MKVEKIGFSIIICQNEDKSGFTYNHIYDFPEYNIGDDLRQRLECTDEADCEKFS